MGIQFLTMQDQHRRAVEKYMLSQLERLGDAAYSRARRTRRIAHRARVTIRGKRADGKDFSQDTQTLDVSDIGARVLLKTQVARGEPLTLSVVESNQSSCAHFRAVWQGIPGTELEEHTGLELAFVDLWGLHHLDGQ